MQETLFNLKSERQLQWNLSGLNFNAPRRAWTSKINSSSWYTTFLKVTYSRPQPKDLEVVYPGWPSYPGKPLLYLKNPQRNSHPQNPWNLSQCKKNLLHSFLLCGERVIWDGVKTILLLKVVRGPEPPGFAIVSNKSQRRSWDIT